MNSTQAIISLVGVLLWTSCGQSKQEEENSPNSDNNEAAESIAVVGKLLTAEDLNKSLSSSINIQVIDFRRATDFGEGHIPGAINLDKAQLQNNALAYGGMIARRENVERTLSAAGLDSSRPVVIYDARGEVDAARLWWVLSTYGHKDVYLLDGGLRSWVNKRYALTTEQTVLEPSGFRFPSSRNGLIHATMKQVTAAIGSDDYLIVDCRSPQEYANGHIPGSINVDWANAINFGGDQKFKSREQLKQLYAEAGIDGSRKIITYCRSGVRSSHTAFVFSEILGFENVQNYDGSWLEWTYHRQAIEK